MKERAVYREISPLEKARAFALARCSLPPASFVKRFARELRDQANGGTITERQAAQLAVQIYRFRRQIADKSLVPDAPPPGYVTPKMRAEEYRLREYRAAYERSIASRPAPVPQMDQPSLFAR